MIQPLFIILPDNPPQKNLSVNLPIFSVNIQDGNSVLIYQTGNTVAIFIGDDSTDAQAIQTQILNYIASNPSVPITIAGNPAAPAPPQNLQSVVNPDDSVTLTWNPVNRATGYRVYRTTISGSYGSTPIYDGQSTTFNDSPAQGILYYYVVTAYVPRGESGYSNEAQAQT